VIRLKWFPPSWFLITFEDKVIYIDPAWIQSNFARYPKRVIFSHYPDPMDGLPEPDLPKADIVLVTHHHRDHQKRATIDRLSNQNTLVVGTQRCTADLGDAIRVVEPGEELAVSDIRVRVVDAYNTPEGNSTRKQHKKGECCGYLVEIDGRVIYHAGDTDLIPEMRDLGKVDVALLPVGGRFTMDAEEAARATSVVKPKFVIPMHFLETDPEEFGEKAEEESGAKVVVLNTGGVFELDR